MLWLVPSLLLIAVAIVLVGALTSSLEVDGFGAALFAAFIMTAVGWLIAAPMGMLETAIFGAAFGAPGPIADLTAPHVIALQAGLAFVINTLLFGLVAAFTPGIAVRGIWGVVLAAALITVVDVAGPYLILATGSHA